MHPILIDTEVFDLYTYGAMGAVGFVVLCVLALLDAKRRGYEQEAVVDVIFWTALAAIAGARLVFLVQHPEVVQGPLDVIDIRSGGLVFYGSMLALPVGIGVTLRHGLPLWDVADLFARLFPLAHGIARLGCFAAGCCYGLPSSAPWAVSFHDEHSVAPLGVDLHPTQLYEAAALFGLFTFLSLMAPRKRFDGQILLTYLLSYAVLRSVIELFRGDIARGFFAEEALGQVISTSQAISVLVVVVVAVAWPLLARRQRSDPTPG